MEFSQVDVQTLAVRIEKLESANRRWKSASVIALLFVISLLLLSTRHAERVAAAAKPDRIEPEGVIRARTVEAQDFVLKDEDGHVYARFGFIPAPITKILQFSTPGSPRLYIEQGGPGQASLQFYDEKGQLVWSAPSKPQFMTVK